MQCKMVGRCTYVLRAQIGELRIDSFIFSQLWASKVLLAPIRAQNRYTRASRYEMELELMVRKEAWSVKGEINFGGIGSRRFVKQCIPAHYRSPQPRHNQWGIKPTWLYKGWTEAKLWDQVDDATVREWMCFWRVEIIQRTNTRAVRSLHVEWTPLPNARIDFITHWISSFSSW